MMEHFTRELVKAEEDCGDDKTAVVKTPPVFNQ
jgi:hypothetical protein